jgi:hypothetical protein
MSLHYNQSNVILNKRKYNNLIMSFLNNAEISNFCSPGNTPSYISIPHHMVEIKNELEKYNMYKSGSKQILIRRLFSVIYLTYYTIKIQSAARKYFYKKYLIYRGPALYKREMCNNITDLFTLDNITDIPQHHFFSFKDLHGFIYGFDIETFITLCLKGVRDNYYIFNPYNRNILPVYVIDNFSFLIKLYCLLYGTSHQYKNDFDTKIVPVIQDFKQTNNDANDVFYNNDNVHLQSIALETYPSIMNYIMNVSGDTPVLNNTNNINTNINIMNNINNNNNINDNINDNLSNNLITNNLFNDTIMNYDDNTNYIISEFMSPAQLFETNEIEERIRTLFNNINIITDMKLELEWFMDFNEHHLIIFIYHLQDIWRYRANITDENRRDICPNSNDLFENIALIYPLYPINNIRMEIIYILEKLVNDGIHDYAKFTGSIFVIGTLTMISESARNEYNWLYLSFS